MTLFLIRHLQTEYNRKGILQGTQDIPILPPSLETLAQINQNKKILAHLAPFDTILVSEYQRTQMTAEAYGYQASTDFQIEKLLNELNFGDYEGKTKADLIAEQGDLWLNTPEQLTLGEPLRQLAQRVHHFIEKYQQQQKILIFGHGSWLRAIKAISRQGNIQTMNQVSIANNELFELSINHQQ
jgi:probable phosphoglycerate mutase